MSHIQNRVPTTPFKAKRVPSSFNTDWLSSNTQHARQAELPRANTLKGTAYRPTPRVVSATPHGALTVIGAKALPCRSGLGSTAAPPGLGRDTGGSQ